MVSRNLEILSAQIAWAKRVSVTNYSVESGEVTLQHKTPSSKYKIALIDVNLLLETLKTPSTRIGEWVNVIGYVTKQKAEPSSDRPLHATSIQAIIYWSAGPLKTDEYEDAVTEGQASHLAS